MKKYVKPTTPKKSQTNQPLKDVKPNKKNINNSTNKQKVYKSQVVTVTKDKTIKEMFIRKNDIPKERKHPEYGTSKLEEKFAKYFLDKLNIEYQYQYKAESIERYFDFFVTPYKVILEVNGGYWHSDPRLYEGKELTPTQKKNKKIDKIKKKWADEHRIPIYYFWEKDINETPSKVLEELKQIIENEKERFLLEEKKKNRKW